MRIEFFEGKYNKIEEFGKYQWKVLVIHLMKKGYSF